MQLTNFQLIYLYKWNIYITEVIIQCDLKATIMSLKMAKVRSKSVLSTRLTVFDLLS